MALFSRRSKPKPQPESAIDPAGVDEPPQSEVTDAAATAASSAPAETPGAAGPAVPEGFGISMSSYGGFGAVPAAPAAPAAATAAASAPPAAGAAQPAAVPGIRDNVLVRDALAALPEKPDAKALIGIARQLLQGHLYLRVRGDARTLLSEGKPMPVGVVRSGDKEFVLAYSSGRALGLSIKADGATDTSAVSQPVLSVLRYVLAGDYAGLVLDNSSAPARAVLPRDLIEKMVAEADESLAVKSLLASERTPATASATADALTSAKFWVAVNRPTEGEQIGIAEVRTAEGDRLIALYSHPLEVIVSGRGDAPAPMTAAQLASALRKDEGIGGVIIDPSGPWMRLTRDELTPVLALAG